MYYTVYTKNNFVICVIVELILLDGMVSKYLEGELKTHENWAFLTRFCFLSEQGEFEYTIEYNEEQGTPNLLLYYDTDDQWPAVYKTNKTCYEKEAVLHMDQNQIINLTAELPRYRDLAGCTYMYIPPVVSTELPKYTTKLPSTKKFHENFRSHTTSMDFNYQTEISPTISSIPNDTNYPVTEIISNYFNFTFPEYNNQSNETNIWITETTTFSNIQTSSSPSSKLPIQKRSVPKKNIIPKKMASKRIIICQNARRFQSSRERWWFVAVSNCNASKGIHIKYKIMMTNGPPGDYWHEHFSADQFYILPVLMAFSVAYSFMMLAIILCSVELKSRQLLHSTYKLFVLSAIIQFFGIMFQSCAYLKYAANGVGAPAVKTFGSMFMGGSETCFLLLLLLLAKGYTVTRGRLPLAASVKLTIFMCLYCVTYICLFVYEAKVFDPGEVLYLYESPAGYGLIILRILAWLMFIYSTVFTLKHYPEKSNFYYPFNICGTLWFIAGPAFILSANSYIDKWVRESVVCAVLLLITFGGHLTFFVLTMPSVANKNFPYHVRTTQIGIMEMTGTAGASTIQHFSHHIYEPSNEQTVIIPLTRRTEEIFGGLYGEHLNSNFAKPARRPSIQQSMEESTNAHNITLQNVLTWSLAKSYPPANNIDLDGNNQETSLQLYQRNQSLPENQEDPNHSNTSHQSYEYVREVPVELFSVSKMVIKNKNTFDK